MKILFFDSLMPKGHKKINNRYLKLFREMDYDVSIAANRGHFSDTELKTVGKNWYDSDAGAELTRWQAFMNFIKLFLIIKREKFDIIYIASYDICVFFVAFIFLIGHKNIVLQEHNNIDQLQNKWKKRMYDAYKNRFYHSVFEESFKTRLCDLGVKEEKIFVVPHPCDDIDGFSINNNRNCIALSNSNDEELISKIHQLQLDEQYFTSEKVRLIIKSRNISYDDGTLSVRNGWLEEKDLNEYYNNSTYVLLLFPASYSYRVSAVFMEAIAKRRYVIASRFPLLEYYAEKYPGICTIFNTVRDIPDCFSVNVDEYEVDRKRFIEDHSDKLIKNSFQTAFDKIVKNNS